MVNSTNTSDNHVISQSDAQQDTLSSQKDFSVAASLLDVTYEYTKGVYALDHISFSIPSGKRTCIVGANGSGKSTVASILSGLTAPDAGTVTFFDTCVVADGHVDFEAYKQIRTQLGLVFQNPEDQIINSIVEDDIAFGLENLQVPCEQITPLVQEQLEKGSLAPFALDNPQLLSGGQQQRVAISGALVMKPQLLVLDEPSASLDVKRRHNVMSLVKNLRTAKKTVVHITHFMNEVISADHVIALNAGKVAFEGDPKDFFKQTDLIEQLHLDEPFAYKISSLLNKNGIKLEYTSQPPLIASQLAKILNPQTVHAEECTLQNNATSQAVKYSTGTSEANYSPNAATDPAIKAKHISFAYHKQVLNNVSFKIGQGQHTAIIGPTGSGKSTLARLICALDIPDTGSLTVAGLDTNQKQNQRTLHGVVGYVMQHPERQLFAQTVYEDIAFGPTNLGFSKSEIKNAVDRAIELVGLTSKKDASPFELSGGQQRLCALAGVLAMQPKILVLDEPTAGLDPYFCNKLRTIISLIKKRTCTIIEITHSMDDAVLADHLILLDHGTVIFSGPPKTAFTKVSQSRLHATGLGIPQALAWAHYLSQKTKINLGKPLTLDELTHTLLAHLSHSYTPHDEKDLKQGGSQHGA